MRLRKDSFRGLDSLRMKAEWPIIWPLHEQPVGCEDGEALIMRCPCAIMVSTPQSLWEEDSCADSLAHTRGRQITPAEQRRQTWIDSIDPVRRATRAATRAAIVENRRRTILRERDEKRTYAAIGREHGITRERVRKIILRAREVLEHPDTTSP